MGARAELSVLWREGMFLSSQHFQAFSRELEARIHSGDSVGRPGDYGVVDLSIDAEALERDVLRLESARILMRDGTMASFPENAHVEPREFLEFLSGPSLMVYLGVPAVLPGRPQIGDGKDRLYRYAVDVRETGDDNQRGAEKEIEFRALQGHLFFGDEDRSGFESIPIARLVRRGQPVAETVLCPTWVGPVLRVGASAALMALLRDLAERARQQAVDLANHLPATTSLSSVEKGADLAGLVKLQAVNQSVGELEQLARLPDLHPYDAYLELVRTVGNLAIFGDERVPPELPAYDHARLDEAFARVAEEIRSLLLAEVSVPYDTKPFEEDPAREGIFACKIPADWLAANPIFYLGVAMDKPQEEVAELVEAGVKLLADADLEYVLQGVTPGIALEPLRIPPTSFPKRAGLHFFRIETEGASRDLWVKVLEAKQAVILSALGAIEEVGWGLYVELRG